MEKNFDQKTSDKENFSKENYFFFYIYKKMANAKKNFEKRT